MCDLRVAPGQEHLVAPNAISIAEAYPYPQAWCARTAGGGPEPFHCSLGFVRTGETADDEPVLALRL